MKQTLITLLFLLLSLSIFAQDKPAYKLFDKNGEPVLYKDMLLEMSKSDIVFFGEIHNDPICHWLQIELTHDLYVLRTEDLVLGAEMFERDNQIILSEYLSGVISESNFESEARLWNNYKTDYKPLINFAKEFEVDFVATNIPRRYASVVFKKGLDTLKKLDKSSKQFIAPLPIKVDLALKCYADMLSMSGDGEEANPNFAHAQAVKDATMAHFLLENMGKKTLFLHFNGTYHSNNHEGIVSYVLKNSPSKKVITLSTVNQENLNELDTENLDLADYILCVPNSMTKTY